ncbi:hypothetical protein CEP53_012899 [Fusarium sp. AF-6]|nr:hypothetical protein CEP53_012899 [Fusarium sp. AF-6]
MAMVASRVPGWGDDKFLHEYTDVHAGMTQNIAAQVPVLRNYTQVVAVPRPAVRLSAQVAKNGLGGDLAARASSIVEASSGTTLLRYAMNKSVTPDDTNGFFANTPFLTADWTTMGAMEQFWFADVDGATAFLGDETRRRVLEDLPESFDLHKSVLLVGRENRVVNKDEGF